MKKRFQSGDKVTESDSLLVETSKSYQHNLSIQVLKYGSFVP